MAMVTETFVRGRSLLRMEDLGIDSFILNVESVLMNRQDSTEKNDSTALAKRCRNRDWYRKHLNNTHAPSLLLLKAPLSIKKPSRIVTHTALKVNHLLGTLAMTYQSMHLAVHRKGMSVVERIDT